MNPQTELATTDGTALVPKTSGHLDMGRLLDVALDKLGGPNAPQAVEALAVLVEMHRTIRQDEAVRAFNQSFAHVQANLPALPKKKHVSIKGGAQFDFAEWDVMDRKVKPVLRAAGMTVYYTEVAPLRDPKNTRSRCTLAHVDGHSISAEVEAPPDNKNPMGDMHKGGGVNSFTSRYAFMRVLGIVPGGDDGGGLTPEDDVPTITENQRMTIETLISDSGTDLAKFLGYYQIDCVDNLPADRYAEASAALEKKLKSTK